MSSTPPDDFVPRLLQALTVGLIAGLIAAALCVLFMPEDQWEQPSLKELLGLTNFQAFLLVLGGGSLGFLGATLAQWPSIVDDCRSRMLERACQRANAIVAGTSPME